jgi:hypothetical protein
MVFIYSHWSATIQSVDTLISIMKRTSMGTFEILIYLYIYLLEIDQSIFP